MLKGYIVSKQNNKRKILYDICIKVKNFIEDNSIQLGESIILIISIMVPFFLDIKGMFEQYLKDNYLTPDNVVQYLLIIRGKYAVAIGIFVIALIAIRKHNKEIIMNKRNVYHDYSFEWYCYCAKILGIDKCSLVLVPIFMQFKLVIQNVFNEFPLDETSYPVQDNEIGIKVSKVNWNLEYLEINLILEDTYPIFLSQIPSIKKNLPTLIISRNDGKNVSRHFSQQYIDRIINEVRQLKNGVIVNIYATTNPMNTLNISKRVFTNASRGNVASLYVFQQENTNERLFKSKGKKIY